MKRIFIIFLVLFFALPAYAKHQHPEKYYQEIWCAKKKGIIEYKLDDKTRVDCLTVKYAVEVDFAPKWHECIGQALYYAKKTKRIPACLLILENADDTRFLKRLRYTVYQKKKIPEFRTYTIKPVYSFIDEDVTPEEY